MAQPTIDIDEVVREVLAQLGLAPAVPAPSHEKKPPEPSAPSAPESQPSAGDGQLVVSARVVTLAELTDRLTGVRQVIVPPQAIVTPAVRDELRRRKIAILSGQKTVASSNSGSRLVLLVAREAMEPAGLVGMLESDGIAVDVQTSDCLIQSADRLAKELSGGNTLGALATTYVPAALCLANRLAGVRAVWGRDPREVAADTAAIGANLLVFNPAGMGLFQMKQLVGRFYSEPKHACPKVFQERLG